ncbi:acyltransferase family protein [Asticcacaulis machinosus]|uniref:Acyltransferase n=1 Tax=Asticcacaulis machinosus TaxID=2984211 RepID=A0ABT5HJ36_9CAUL|nr:acyltransferase [Asticcacaulis machinosus]MDC7676252.1 acyltransferase [Asticcacaulis machinosus]
MNTSVISETIRPPKAAAPVSVNDVARGISILLVLLVHCIVIFNYPGNGRTADVSSTEVGRVLSTFIMPAFYFISGLTAISLASRSLRKILTSCGRFILLALVTQVLAAPLLLVTHSGANGLDFAAQFIRPLLTGKDFILIVTWYLVSLAGVQFLAWLYLRGSIWIKLGVIAIVTAAFMITSLTGKTYFMFHTWAIGGLFFLAGREFGRRFTMEGPKPYALMASLACIVLLVLVYDLNKGCTFSPTQVCAVPNGYPHFYVDVVYGQFGFIPYFLLSATIGIAALMAVSMVLSRTFLSLPLTRIGKNTLVLLLMNGVFMALAPTLLARIIPTLPGIWIISVALVAGQVVLYPFMSRPINSLLHMCSNWADYIARRIVDHLPKLILTIVSKQPIRAE